MSPGRKWYLVALIVLLAGGGAVGLFLWSRLAALAGGLQRFVVPGATVLALDEPGTYTIFYEARSFYNGRYYASDSVAGLRIAVTDEASGAALALSDTAASAHYEIGSHSGVSVLTFEVPAAGRYRMSGAYAGNRPEPEAVFAVGHGFVARLILTILGGIAIGFAAMGSAAAIEAIIYVKRRRARDRAAGEQARGRVP